VLIEFQRALADLTASPALCRQARSDSRVLRDRYELTDKEWRRLVGIVSSRGMEANCILYRANRLAPVALNLPDTCGALGDELNRIVSAYWDCEPITDVHFLVEADRFRRYLLAEPDLPPAAAEALAREGPIVAGKLAASRFVAGTPAKPLPDATSHESLQTIRASGIVDKRFSEGGAASGRWRR
jgi:hypothetical protein